MSENDKDNKDFEFIKEQIIEKKRKKLRKWLLPFLLTILLAILFGLIAAVTFVLSEPELSKLLHKDDVGKTPISFPTEYPEDSKNIDQTEQEPQVSPTPKIGQDDQQKEPVIVEKSIDADINDYIKMNDEIRVISYEVNKSILRVASTMKGKDWFGNPVEKTINTTGLVIWDNGSELLTLVSLDRVEGASSIKVELTDSISVAGTLKNYDRDLNLAVVAVKSTDIPTLFTNTIKVATLGESYSMMVGDPIIALGNPNGYQYSMETGMITSMGSTISVTDNKLDLFNTSIEDNISSDGVIVNMKGEVIGLITRTLKENENANLNTVIGISKIKKIIRQLANNTPKVYFGVKTEDMTDDAKQEYDVTNGIYVNEVMGGSPAFDSGIKNGDIILRIDDAEIVNTNNFFNIIMAHKPGDEVNVTIKRTSGTSKKEMKLKITLKEVKK